MKPPVTSQLLLFPGALGDAVCVEPATAWLARRGPVTLYARGAAAEVARLFPARPHVCSLDAVEVARLFAPEDDPRTASWLARHDRIVSFTGATVAHVRHRLAATGRAVCAPFPQPPLPAHAADTFLRAASGDPDALAPAPRLVAPGGVAKVASRLVVLPGSGGRGKRAAAWLFAAIARRWCEHGGEACVVLGPAEEGEDRSWQELGAVVRPGSIAALAGTLASAGAFVGNDAGPSHVAAALGVVGVVLYTATEPHAFGPRGDRVVAVRVADPDPSADAPALAAAWRILRAQLP
jgi:hypothetical protein